MTKSYYILRTNDADVIITIRLLQYTLEYSYSKYLPAQLLKINLIN